MQYPVICLKYIRRKAMGKIKKKVIEIYNEDNDLIDLFVDLILKRQATEIFFGNEQFCFDDDSNSKEVKKNDLQ